MHVIDYFNHSLYSQEKHILVAIHLAEASPSLRKEWPNQQQKTARISTQLEKMQEQKKVVEYPNLSVRLWNHQYHYQTTSMSSKPVAAKQDLKLEIVRQTRVYYKRQSAFKYMNIMYTCIKPERASIQTSQMPPKRNLQTRSNNPRAITAASPKKKGITEINPYRKIYKVGSGVCTLCLALVWVLSAY
jgi:hypothetical protein